MSEFLKYFCEHCGQKIGAPVALAGAETPCPACNRTTRVPLPGSPTALGVNAAAPAAPGPFGPAGVHAGWGEEAEDVRRPPASTLRPAPSAYAPQLAGPPLPGSPLAVSALILGAAGLATAWACVGVLFGPPALICGALALGRREPRRGFAIAGLILGALATMGGCVAGALNR